MVIVDFSHLGHRNLYTAISLAKPKKSNKKYITDEFMPMFYHLMLNSLRHISRKFPNNEIVLAIDGKNNWRKEIYPEYKGHRKKNRDESDINFNEYFSKLEAFINILDKCFPYKVIKVDGVEADDIIAVLSKRIEGTIVVTSDKDMKQCLLYNARMYDPIKQKEIEDSLENIKLFKDIHVLIGDKSDNVPSVREGLEYSTDFIKFLKENNVFVYDVDKLEFEYKDLFEKIKKEFEEKCPDKDIYKKARFGEKTALKFLREGHFKEALLSKKFKYNYKRNQQLIDFDFIPKKVEEKIWKTYLEKEVEYNGQCIQKFLLKFNLNEQFMNMNDFSMQSKVQENLHQNNHKTSELDEWS